MKKPRKEQIISNTTCPQGMTPKQWQIELRRQAARKEPFVISDSPDHSLPGLFIVSTAKSRRNYRVIYRGPQNNWNACDCMDFRTSRLGTCKHIEAVAQWLDAKHREPDTRMPRNSALDIDYSNGRRVRLRLGSTNAESIALAAMRYFDDDRLAEPGMLAMLPTFIEQVRKLDPRFHVTSDALNLILEERDRRRRHDDEKTLSDKDIDALVNATLYPYQKEGVRFAYRAGRSLIADEMGLGKTVQAIATAELFRKRNMVASTLIVCPTSLKYQWQKEIARFTGQEALIIEGQSTRRRELYSQDYAYKIVSYHTLANDIKVLGKLRTDLLIMDEVQRLKNWNTQISQAARRIESEYAVILSGTPLENKLDELYSVMQFVDQYALGPLYQFIGNTIVASETGKVVGYRNLSSVASRIKDTLIRRRKTDVALQLPERTDKVLFVPLTKEQRAIHDDAQAVVAQLVYKWNRMKFLSEKDRKRLLLTLTQMRMVCDSTYLIDQKSRNDTKVAEAVQLVADMIDNGDGKAVIFSQWERMTRIVAEELDRAGIKYEYLHGAVPAAKRGGLCQRFTDDPEVRVFLSTDAGATGLNLQTASLLINLDLPWNPAVLEQRCARIHRIGQQRNVQIVNLVATGTIEERMLATLNFKSKLFEGVLDGGEDQITLDDNRLTKVVESLNVLINQEDTIPIAEAPESEIEEEITDDTPQPEQLIANTVNVLRGFAATLQSEKGIATLVDALVKTDDKGQTTLQIPVDSKETVSAIFTTLAKLFK